MKKIADCLDGNFSKNIEKIVKLASSWKHIVGIQLSKVTLPVRISNNILNVMVSEPAWQYELSMFKGDILERIPKDFQITDIKFFVRYIKKDKDIKQFRDVTEKELKIIDRLVRNISDEELRGKFKDAMIGYFRNFSYHESLDLE